MKPTTEEKEKAKADNEGFKEVVNKKKKADPFNYTQNQPRQTRSSTRKSVPTKTKIEGVNSCDTLQKLKLLIYQKMDIAPFQQNLYTMEDVPLDHDNFILNKLGILPEDTLQLEKREESELFLDDFVNTGNYKEEGFAGTIFSSSNFVNKNKVDLTDEKWSCSQCTFENEPSELKCHICEYLRTQ